MTLAAETIVITPNLTAVVLGFGVLALATALSCYAIVLGLSSIRRALESIDASLKKLAASETINR